MNNNLDYQHLKELKVPLRVVEKVLGISVEDAMFMYYSLTDKRRELFELIAVGYSKQEIADKTGDSVYNVRMQFNKTCRYLHISSDLEIAKIVFMVKLASSNDSVVSP